MPSSGVIVGTAATGVPQQITGLGVEGIDHGVPDRHEIHQPVPIRLIAPRVEVIQGNTLLLNPGVVTQIENPFATGSVEFQCVIRSRGQQVASKHFGRPQRVEFSKISLCTAQLRAVHLRPVRRDGYNGVAGTQFHVFRVLDRPQDIGDRGEAQIAEGGQLLLPETRTAAQIVAADRRIEQQIKTVARPVGHADDEIRIHHIVDQWHMLVADTLNVVIPVTVVEQCRTFQRLDDADIGAKRVFEVVACGERPGGSGCGDESPRLERAVPFHRLKHSTQGRACDGAVDDVVSELGKLVENDVVRVLRQPVAGVVDFLDVAFGARRPDDIAWIGHPVLEPGEPLGAHSLRQYGNAMTSKNSRDRNPAAAIVSGRRPNRAVALRVEFTGQQTRHQTAIGRQHLVRADHRKPVAQRDDNFCIHARQIR